MKRVQKPIRLYVLTIFIVIAYGVMPFISVLPFAREVWLFGLWNLPLNGSIYFLYGPDGAAPFFLILVSLFLCVFSAASAVWAFYGDLSGKWATLVLITLNVLWWTGLVLTVLVNMDPRDPGFLRLIFEPIPPLGWLGFIWWNFTRPDVNEYYRYLDQERVNT